MNKKSAHNAKKISVVIVTKNREYDLLHCLGSLLTQSYIPSEIIIINNQSTDQTKKRVTSLSKCISSSVRVRVIDERKSGYPAIYNRGLKEASNDWVAFIDDDCVADVNWYEKMLNSITSTKNAAVLGYSGTYYHDNIFSLTMHFLFDKWKEKYISKNKVLFLEVLDNKNIVYNRLFLREKSVSYDESRTYINNGASEDCDLGVQIQLAGGQGVYAREAIVYHKDPITFTHFFRKFFFADTAFATYVEKWQKNKEWLELKKKGDNKNGFFYYLSQYRKKMNISLLQTMIVFFLSSLVIVFQKMRRLVEI